MLQIILCSIINTLLNKNVCFSFSMSSEFDSHELFSKENVKAKQIVSYHFSKLLAKIPQKISTRKTFSDPWTVVLSCEIEPTLFYRFYRAIKDHKLTKILSEFMECSVIRNNKIIISDYKISFHTVGLFRRNMKKICDKDNWLLSKKFPDQSLGTIESIVITYKVSTGKCVFKLPYSITSLYGVVITT